MDLSGDVSAITRIRDMAEKVKVELTNSPNADFNLPYITVSSTGTPLHINVKVARTKLDYLADGLIKQTITFIEECLKEANLTKESITDVVFGGGTFDCSV